MDKEFDFATAKPVAQVPALQKLRQAYQQSGKDEFDFIHFFDNDVRQTIKQHNNPHDRVRLNEMIRLLFATA